MGHLLQVLEVKGGFQQDLAQQVHAVVPQGVHAEAQVGQMAVAHESEGEKATANDVQVAVPEPAGHVPRDREGHTRDPMTLRHLGSTACPSLRVLLVWEVIMLVSRKAVGGQVRDQLKDSFFKNIFY